MQASEDVNLVVLARLLDPLPRGDVAIQPCADLRGDRARRPPRDLRSDLPLFLPDGIPEQERVVAREQHAPVVEVEVVPDAEARVVYDGRTAAGHAIVETPKLP